MLDAVVSVPISRRECALILDAIWFARTNGRFDNSNPELAWNPDSLVSILMKKIMGQAVFPFDTASKEDHDTLKKNTLDERTVSDMLSEVAVPSDLFEQPSCE